MKITCPECQAVGRIGDRWQGKKVRCPQCRHVFVADDPSLVAGDDVAVETEPVPAPPPLWSFAFTGDTRTLFRLWLKNSLFTLLTLAIYRPWAKVSERVYLYSRTTLNGQSFAYLGDPLILLRGHALLGAALLCYLLAKTVFPPLAPPIVFVVALLVPRLLYASHDYLARSSCWREAHFRFVGSLGEGYLVYFLLPLFLPLSLGLLLPYWAYRQKKYFLGHMTFGSWQNELTIKVSYFYTIYLRALLLLVAVIGPLVFLFVALGFAQSDLFAAGLHGGTMSGALVAFITFCYLGLLLVIIVVGQYITARISNYCWQNCRLGPVSFHSTLRARDLMWIRLSNILLILLSLGLLFPWAKVRRTRYILAHLQLEVAGDERERLV